MQMLSSLATRLYALSLLSFPSHHRAEYRAEMLDTFRRSVADRRHRAGAWAALQFGIAASVNAIGTGLGERRRGRESGRTGGSGFSLRRLGPDLVHAFRSLRAARAFTFVSVVSLGVGMGTVIGLLMFLRVLLGAPPVINTDNLVELLVVPQGALRAQADDWAIETWSYPDFDEVRTGNTGMTVAGWVVGRTLLRPPAGAAQRLASNYVSPAYFTAVGVTLARGRGFAERDSEPQPVVIVSHHLWKTTLGSDPNIVGTTLSVDNVAHVVVGVAPEGFGRHLSGLEEMPVVHLYFPLSQHPRLQGAKNARFDRTVDWVRVLGRLDPGTSLGHANAAVSSIIAGIAERYPATNALKQASVEAYFPAGARMRDEATLVQSVFLGLSSLVLLVVCLNISGMVLVRGARREREIAVRLALGASRKRLIQNLLSESFVLALLGGALATSVIFGVPPLVAWWLDTPLPDPRLRADATMAAISLGLCFVTSLIFGLMPAIRFSRPALVSALKDESGSGGSRRVGRSHRITAAIQAGIAVPFLVICGLKLDNVRVTATADLGFTAAGLYALPLDVETSPPLGTVRRSIELSPGVTSVTFADALPLGFIGRTSRVSKDDDASMRRVYTTTVDTGYLETMGIPLKRGRSITAEDRHGSALVVLLSEPLAAQLFPGGDAIGQRLTLRVLDDTPQTVTVIGVTGDVVASQMASPRPQMFLPLSQYPSAQVLVIARSTASVESMQASLQAVLPTIGRDLVQSSMITGQGLIEESQWDLFSHSAVAGVCAGITLILTALGVFGVVGFMVATRTREIGVRIALGASRTQVLGMVLRETAMLVLPGVAVGLVLAVYLVRVDGFEVAFYDLGAAEPIAYAIAAAVTVGVALLSGLPSARRAAKVEPIVAMRTD